MVTRVFQAALELFVKQLSLMIYRRMYCVEEIDRNGGFIELYWYDWYDDQKELVMKFHAHYHPDETPANITMYDPFHIHTANERRLNNEKFQELYTILEFTRLRNISIKL
ncbi:DUF6516 family protein [Paenibacillus sp. FSL L8-0435]|uniref:toxin-antitoxin system TumE family protein n=1 Tax=Paenibacillus sp. FSL L8-0435 TaxID=2954618 RepID=UPI0030DD7580